MALIDDLQRAVAELSINMNGVPPTHVAVGPEVGSIETQSTQESLYMLATYCMHLYLKVEHIYERTKSIGPMTVTVPVADAALTEFKATNQLGPTWKDRALWLEERLLAIAGASHDLEYVKSILRVQGVSDDRLDSTAKAIIDGLRTPGSLPSPTENLAWIQSA